MATTPKAPPPKSHDQREDARDERRTVTRTPRDEGAPPGTGDPDQSLPPADGDPIPPTAENPYPTIADEQRARSQTIASMGVEDWKDDHDERTEEEKAGNKQVPGVAPPAPEHASTEGGTWQGSSRTTQAARHAQNPAAPR